MDTRRYRCLGERKRGKTRTSSNKGNEWFMTHTNKIPTWARGTATALGSNSVVEWLRMGTRLRVCSGEEQEQTDDVGRKETSSGGIPSDVPALRLFRLSPGPTSDTVPPPRLFRKSLTQRAIRANRSALSLHSFYILCPGLNEAIRT